MKEKISQIARKLSRGGKNIVFTGAGISTESGISDYRSKGGLWDKFQPVYFDDFMSSKESRVQYWRQYAELYPDLMRATPNAAHMAVFELHELGLVEAVITQNIDGLHQASGLGEDAIIELHGNSRRIRCMSCMKLSSLQEVQQRLKDGDPAPECDCGGYLKPDTISFGQAMPLEAVEKATRLSSECDVFMVIGSTLLVQPAALMPVYAKQNNAFLSIINLSETPCDKMCDVLIREKAGTVMTEILKRVRGIKGEY
jgi:NAD-dependent deacetylase